MGRLPTRQESPSYEFCSRPSFHTFAIDSQPFFTGSRGGHLTSDQEGGELRRMVRCPHNMSGPPSPIVYFIRSAPGSSTAECGTDFFFLR
jgi:hypothetical protein